MIRFQKIIKIASSKYVFYLDILEELFAATYREYKAIVDMITPFKGRIEPSNI